MYGQKILHKSRGIGWLRNGVQAPNKTLKGLSGRVSIREYELEHSRAGLQKLKILRPRSKLFVAANIVFILSFRHFSDGITRNRNDLTQVLLEKQFFQQSF